MKITYIRKKGRKNKNTGQYWNTLSVSIDGIPHFWFRHQSGGRNDWSSLVLEELAKRGIILQTKISAIRSSQKTCVEYIRYTAEVRDKYGISIENVSPYIVLGKPKKSME